MRTVKSCSLGNSLLNDIHQLKGSSQRLFFACRHNKLRDTLRPAFLTVTVNNIRQLFFLVVVDDVLCIQTCFFIHAHIQRSVMHIRKTTLRGIQLIARNTKVKKDTVNFIDSHRIQHLGKVFKIGLGNCGFAGKFIQQAFGTGSNSIIILINANQKAACLQLCGKRTAVPRTAHSAVHVNTIFICYQKVHALSEQNTCMLKFHSQHQSYIPKSASCSASSLTSSAFSSLYSFQRPASQISALLPTPTITASFSKPA